jgi:predicted SnoaL-like aldol condensation-catalyzing enzyme
MRRVEPATDDAAQLAQGDLVQRVMRPDSTDPGKTRQSYWFDRWRVREAMIVEHRDSAVARQFRRSRSQNRRA